MKLSKTSKQLLFFWIVFHSIGYLSFLTNFTPVIKSEDRGYYDRSYILTPDYNGHYDIEKEHFYPFHKFKGSSYTYNRVYSEFVGVYGYYGHYEYIVYVLFPLFVIGLSWIYKNIIIK